ncbi:MAG: TerC family protein [Alphaproteobacteria bacterium]
MEALFLTVFLGKALWVWLVFFAIVLLLLAIDLGVLHRDQHEIGVKESLLLSGGYITVSLLFGLWVWHEMGQESALEYYTGYVIEKSLSIDNIFVMAIIFSAMYIPRAYQHRVLFWGILGVIVMRGLMIGLGAALVHRFEWVLYIFAAFLMFTGVKLLFMKDEGDHGKSVENNPIIVFLRRNFRIANELHGQRFFIRQPDPKTGKIALFMTPLFLALVTIEFADLIFAVDSVPAIFAITTDTYIVYTSNVFAILGLRSLYFALSAMIERFAYLKYALALILIFIGSKVFVIDLFNMEKFPASVSLGVTIGLLAAGIFYSLYKTRDLKGE